MTKKHLVIALSFFAMILIASSAMAQTCSGTPQVQFMGGGSSAQFNTLAYATSDVLTTEGGSGAGFNFMAAKKNATVVDSGPTYEATSQPALSDSATFWLAYDNAVNCNVYVYFSLDSGIGVKNFLRSVKYVSSVNGKTFQVAGAYPTFTSGIQTTACNGTSGNCNQVGGLADQISSGCTGSIACTLDIMPATVFNAVNNYIPANFVNVALTSLQPPPAYCGVQNGTAGFYCSFNAAGTDIRPEDALYAATRALSAYNTTNSLAGLGYSETGCGANATYNTSIGCPIYDAFGQKKVFNVLNFALSGTDPISKGTPPPYTTINVGAAPLVVFVNNADTTTDGFGATYTDAYGNTSYKFHDILDKLVSLYFDGTLSCTGDMLIGGDGAGVPVQVVSREPLSGTYNAFEYTGVRTLYGSAAAAVGINKVSSITWVTDDESGQEFGIDPQLGVSGGCGNGAPSSGHAAIIPCGDPLAAYSGPNPSAPPTTAGCMSGATLLTGSALRLRAIGTGEEVPAALAQYNSTTSASSTSTPFNVVDGLGYAFWSYGNFAPVTVGQSCTTTNPVSCGGYDGHYLTVSGVDPFFYSEGGEAEPSGGANPSGSYNLPQCNLAPGSTAGTLAGGACFGLPFPHIYDGKYPLWSVLRLMTFAPVSGKFKTPPAVLALAAYDMIEVANPNRQTSDFVPFLKNICAPGTQWNGTTCATSTDTSWNGNLNLWVFRSHFEQSKVPPNNGHRSTTCTGGITSTVFFDITGGTATTNCLVDAGGDMGGVPLTVQSDVDFNLDFGGVAFGTVHAPLEVYNLHQ